MTASISGATGESREEPSSKVTAPAPPKTRPAAAAEGSSSVSLMSGTAGDRCAVCAAQLAPDQHYCVECGTRRGKPRFAPPVQRTRTTETTLVTSASPAARFGGNAAVAVALVIVLLALGVGVLIGESGTQTVHVTVAGGGASTAKSSSSGAGASGTATTKATPPKPSSVNSNPFPSN